MQSGQTRNRSNLADKHEPNGITKACAWSGHANALAARKAEGAEMLRAIAAILVVMWLFGFFLHVAGSLIHLLLVIALITILFDLITRRRAVS